MYRYYGIIRGFTGPGLAATSVTVYDDEAGTSVATIYDANGATEDNPTTTNARGAIDVYSPRGALWYKVSGDTVVQPLPRHASGGVVADVTDYGATGNGTTDDSTAVLAAITAVNAAGGGTIFFPVGTYRIDSQIDIPDTSGVQKPFILRGAGAKVDGLYGTAANRTGGTVLDLRYSGAGGKINSEGWGSLTIEDMHLTQAAGADDDTVFGYFINTVVRIQRVTVSGHSTLSGVSCIQDAFQFGGTDTSFQGYTSVVRDVVFDRIRSGIVGRKAANALYTNNIGFTLKCGSNNDQGAIDLESGTGTAIGGLFVHTTLEGDYPYRIRLNDSGNNTFDGIGFYDMNETLVALVKLENGAAGNRFLNVWPGGIDYDKFVARTSGETYLWQQSNVEIGDPVFAGGWELAGVGEAAVTIRPAEVPADGADTRMLSVRRSLKEGTNPNAEVASLRYDGDLTLAGALTTGGSNSLGSSGLVQGGTGALDLYAGTGTSAMVRIQRGVLRHRALATGDRPAASVGAGAVYYDTTISKPVYSDGSKWRDAAGTEIPDA